MTNFADGFMVEFIPTKETIEVANVGHIIPTDADEYVMVHSSHSAEVRTSVADLAGNAFDCAIEGTGSPAVSLPCTTAAFGPTTLTSLGSEGGGLRLSAPLVLPPTGNENGCNPIPEDDRG